MHHRFLLEEVIEAEYKVEDFGLWIFQHKHFSLDFFPKAKSNVETIRCPTSFMRDKKVAHLFFSIIIEIIKIL